MFGPSKTPLTERLRRAAELVRAFALLEDAGDRRPRPTAPTAAAAIGVAPGAIGEAIGSARASAVPHPHSVRLVREPRRGRPGTIAPRPARCLTPIKPQAAGPMRRDLAAPRRLQSHRAGPHHS
jgi:hypothetical protein